MVRVVVADDPVVRGHDESLGRVRDARKLLVGDRALPLELARPARLREVGAVAAPDRDAAGELVADVPLAVGRQSMLSGGTAWSSVASVISSRASARARSGSPPR